MPINALSRRDLLWLLLCCGAMMAVARVDRYGSYRNSKVVGFQADNNRTQFRVGVSNPQNIKYGQVAVNQTRPSWQQSPVSHQNPAPYPTYKQPGNFNRTLPSRQQTQASNYAPYPAYGQRASLNQTRPAFVNYSHPSGPQPMASHYPQYPAITQYTTSNQTRRDWPQPSASQLPNTAAQPIQSWPSSANQTNLYPKLATSNLPSAASSAHGRLSQDPHNGLSGSQTVLSYGPGHYPLPAASPHKTVPVHNGSSNPYANLFN